MDVSLVAMMVCPFLIIWLASTGVTFRLPTAKDWPGFTIWVWMFGVASVASKLPRVGFHRL